VPEAILAGLFGLLIGSFLNVCIHRMPLDESVVSPRSRCPHCLTPIAWYDNIPVLSWLMLKGRCRTCQHSISPRYPIVELLTGVLFAAGVICFGPTWAAAKFCVFAAIMVALIFTDFEERILPDEFTLGGTAAGVLLALVAPPSPSPLSFLVPPAWNPSLVAMLEAASSGLLLSGVLWGIGELYAKVRKREGLGFGDVKMVACIGAFLGLSPALLTVIAGSLLGSLVGIAWIVVGRKDASTYELPFGSFLGVAAIAVALITHPL